MHHQKEFLRDVENWFLCCKISTEKPIEPYRKGIIFIDFIVPKTSKLRPGIYFIYHMR